MAAILDALLEELYDFESLFLSPDDLQRLDVQASQVSLTSGNELNFDPCFFRPYPDGVFAEYPPIEGEDEDPLTPVPTFQDIIDRDPSNPRNEILAKLESGYHLGCFPEWDRINSDENDKIALILDPTPHNLGISDSIESLLQMIRKGSDGKWFCLRDLLANVEKPFFPIRKKKDPPMMILELPPMYWHINASIRYIGRPHSYMSVLSHVYMADTSRGLTRDEVTAIVSMMIIRLNHKPFRKCKVHPVLIFSLFGNQMGRIIQATYDGRDLVLQYSPLWKIVSHESPGMELMVRYRLTKLVDGI